MISELARFFAAAVATLLMAWFCIVWLVCLLGCYQLRTKFTRNYPSKSSRRGSDAPGVSILRPLKGIDTEFEACISSAFEQDYPKFEVLLCVDDPTDPAIAIVRKVMARYPHVPSQLFIGAEKFGVNPKVNNLIRAYDVAQHDILWVLDSNCWVTPGALGRAVDSFEANPSVQLVHHLPLVVDISGHWGSRLDEMFLATAHAKLYVAINTVAVAPCVMGKSNFFRRSQLNKVVPHGIRSFAKYIAEDQQIGDGIWKAGGRHAMTCDVAIQPVGGTSFEDYFFRRMRWLRVRKHIVLVATLVEPMTECFLCGIMGATAFHILTGLSWNVFFTVHVLTWALGDFWIYSNLHRQGSVEMSQTAGMSQVGTRILSPTPYFALPKQRDGLQDVARWIVSWFARELMALPIWIHGMGGTQVEWRNRLYYIKSDSTAIEIKKTGQL
ncbi:glycosyl transferase family 21-domain-containing protein [Lipomyces kononenkoae]|uniref:Glycosyl transferase family 21-domain-containing protein n=1 Tax=Lipomyces kononenkoae TaxID=34357 RepID=A0ACC3T2V1_LIPKO